MKPFATTGVKAGRDVAIGGWRVRAMLLGISLCLLFRLYFLVVSSQKKELGPELNGFGRKVVMRWTDALVIVYYLLFILLFFIYFVYLYLSLSI